MTQKLDKHGQRLMQEIQMFFELGFEPNGYYSASVLKRKRQTAIYIMIIYDTPDEPDELPRDLKLCGEKGG